jgi:NADPH:quinone reductase-like Zn-dependent oxidoreductase
VPYRELFAVRAAGIERFGAPVRELVLDDPRPLGGDEVLIAVRAAGVGNWDEFARVGEWDVGIRPPMALGVQASGIITAVGEEISGWLVGDAVMTHPPPLRAQGTWSGQLIAVGDLLASKPDGTSWEEAAAFPVPALTAHQALTEGVQVCSGDRLLVHGAGGVTGRLVVELARLHGVKVVATAGPRSADALESLGVEAVVDYHDHGWPQAVRELTGGAGVTAAVNAVPGEERGALCTVADGGRFATITGAPPAPERDVTIANVYVRPDGTQLRQLALLLAGRHVEVAVGGVYELADASEALELVTHRGARGAVVLAASPPP